jgi:DNA-binding response OmpR family regulator
MRNILIAEDDISLRDALVVAFSESGFDITTASDGEEAINKLNGSDFNLIILDIMMPKKDGLTVLSEIRNNSKTASLPVIMLTNLDTDNNILDKIIKYNPSYYLLKSNIKISEIVDKANIAMGLQELP